MVCLDAEPQLAHTATYRSLLEFFDQSPQYVYAAPLANSDPSIYDFVGRYVYARMQHTF